MCLVLSGDLRRKCQEDLVYKIVCQELPEQRWSTLVEKVLNGKLIMKDP